MSKFTGNIGREEEDGLGWEGLVDSHDDDIFCSSCGKLVTDGGGLYCSSRCEEIGNPGSEGL